MEINKYFKGDNMEKQYNHTGHGSISTGEYKESVRNLDFTTILKTKHLVYVKQDPFVGEDGIYVPVEPYVEEVFTSSYRCILTREMFVEAYNKWIKDK